MKKKLVEEYFTFSKKERNAVIVLVILIAGIFILPYCLPPNDSIEDDILAAVEASDSSAAFSNVTQEAVTGYYKRPTAGFNTARAPTPIQLFNFDPNNLSEDGWRKLGLKERTIQTISNYLSKGGKFRQPDDLKRIYGISPKHAEQLIPYVKIERQEAKVGQPFERYIKEKSSPPGLIDINEADSVQLIGLKGIGPTLASRIIRFRDRLGGFHSKDQLKEVYGLPDSTSKEIAPRLVFSGEKINKVKINEADFTELAKHPYIGRSLAKLIVNYRQQHGNFEEAEDLLGIDVINEALVTRLSPYLSF
jgi:competence protein ComEA